MAPLYFYMVIRVCASATLAITKGEIIMKKLKNLTKVVPVPNTIFYGEYEYDGEDIELCDDKETFEDKEEKTETFIEVKDYIEKDILYKYKLLKVKQADGRYIIEETKKELPLTKGTKLVYIMYEGFVKTKTPMIKIDEAIKRYELLKSPEEE